MPGAGGDDDSAFGEQLGDHQPRFDRVAEADFVREDAAAFAQAGEGEHDGVDLMGVGVDLGGALGGGEAAVFVGAATAG